MLDKEDLNKKYFIEIEVISPVSIGAGTDKDWMKNLDFVVKNGKVYKLNFRKMLRPDSGIEVDKLSASLQDKDEKRIWNLLESKVNDISEAVFEVSSSPKDCIKSQVKNELSGKPIIPGSSLKGAIRSVLFKELKDKGKNSEKDVFGDSDTGSEFMRFIKISDVEFDKTGLVNTKIFNLRSLGNKRFGGGWKHGANETGEEFKPNGFNTFYEVLLPGEKACGSLMFSECLFDKFGEEKQVKGDVKRKYLDVNNLFDLINRHTIEYLRKELDFFEKYSADKTEEICDALHDICSQIEQLPKSSCILKMAVGSGFHSITGDWIFDDYSIDEIKSHRGCFQGIESAKSRKVAFGKNQFSLMGFVKLRVMSDEEVCAYEQKREYDLKKQEQIREEKRKQKEQEILLQQTKIKYRQLIKIAEGEQNPHEALMKYKQAAAFYPEGDAHDKPLKELEKRLEMEQAELLRQSEMVKAEQERKDNEEKFIANGLAFLDEQRGDMYLVNDLKGAISRIERWLKKSRIDSIPQEQEALLVATLKRLYISEKKRDLKKWETLSSPYWKSIEKVVADGRVHEIFRMIVKKEVL